MKRGLLWCVVLLLLLSSFAGAHHPEGQGQGHDDEDEGEFEHGMMGGMRGPGGCQGEEECREFCAEHPEACKSSQMGMMEGGKGMMMDEQMMRMETMEGGMGMMKSGQFGEKDYTEMYTEAYGFGKEMESDMMMASYSVDDMVEDPEKYMQYCDTPEKMVDLLIEEMESKGGMGKACMKMEEEFKRIIEHAEERCKKMGEHFAEGGPDKNKVIEKCEVMPFPADVPDEMKEQMEKQRVKAKEECEEKMKKQIGQAEKHQAEGQEKALQQCKMHYDQMKKHFEENLQRCKEHMNLKMMKEKMVKQGKMMCGMYWRERKEGRKFFDVMKRMDVADRMMVSDDFEHAIEVEEASEEALKEDTNVPIIKRILRFLGFFKEDFRERLGKLRAAAQQLGESIARLKAVATSLEGEPRDALDEEILRLEAQRDELMDEIAQLGEKVEGMGEELGEGETGIDKASGFFVKFTNFMKGA